MKIYIGCALTHVPDHHFEEYVQYIHSLAKDLKGIQAVETVKYALVDSDPQLSEKPRESRPALCYTWDRAMVEECDLLVADVSFPSTGLGIELQIAETGGKPVIMLVGDYGDNRVSHREYDNPDHQHHELQIGEGIVTLMALGLPTVTKVIGYRDTNEAIRLTVEAALVFTR